MAKRTKRDRELERIYIYVMDSTEKELKNLEDLIKTQRMVNKKLAKIKRQKQK